MFLDEFTEYMGEVMPDPELSNIVLLGDFNLHVSDNPAEIEPATFIDTIEAMGLYQHIGFETHKAGNTLDLVIIEFNGAINIKSVMLGPYLREHRAVIATLTTKKESQKH